MTATPLPSPRTAPDGSPAAAAWLTRLTLDPSDRTAVSDLGNSAALHRRVMSLVPNGLGDSPRAAAGVLFRLDAERVGHPTVLVQTCVLPDTSRLPKGYLSARTRDMTPMLAALRPGLTVRYRLLGNAVRRCGKNSTAGAWKQAIPLHGQEADRWWADRAPAAGLTLHTLLSSPVTPLTAFHPATAPTARTGERPRNIRVPYAGTLFEGTATVHDPTTLRNALRTGVGRGKSYGFGLLSLAPAPTG